MVVVPQILSTGRACLKFKSPFQVRRTWSESGTSPVEASTPPGLLKS
jgi:hypothetical protein